MAFFHESCHHMKDYFLRILESFLSLLYLPNTHFGLLFEDFSCGYHYIDLHDACQGKTHQKTKTYQFSISAGE